MSEAEAQEQLDVESERSVYVGETPEKPEGQVEESTTSEQVEETKEPKKSKGGFQRRIDGLTREKYELQQRLDAQQAQINELRQAEMQAQVAKAGDIPMPKLAEFDFDEEAYGKAVQQWHAAKVEAQQKEQQTLAEQQQMQVREMQRQAEMQQKVASAQEQYPDFSAKVFDPSLPSLRQVNPVAFDTVLESSKFADVAYYLASNPGEVYEFANLSPIGAVRKVFEIEARFEDKPKPTAAAPPPPSTVGGRGETAKSPENMTTDEYIAWRNSQDPRLKR